MAKCRLILVGYTSETTIQWSVPGKGSRDFNQTSMSHNTGLFLSIRIHHPTIEKLFGHLSGYDIQGGQSDQG